MKDKPLFSVIVPVYGVEVFLPKCIESILSQTFNDFELILVDDGSKDKCPFICDEYAEKDKRIKVIHKLNGGLISARQAGVQIAEGHYVACVDGDDFIASEYLNSFAKCITETKAQIVCAGSIWWTSEQIQIEHKLTDFEEYYNKERLEKEIFPYLIEDSKSRYFPNSVWAKVFNLELYKKQLLQLNKEIKIGEDAACVKPCIFYAETMAVIPDCLYYYRQNSASMTKNKKPFNWNGPLLIAEHFKSVLDLSSYDIEQQVYRNCVHNVFNVAVTRFYQEKEKSLIYEEVLEELNRPLYKESIQNAYFTFGSKGWIAKIALKYKFLFLIYLFSKRN